MISSESPSEVVALSDVTKEFPVDGQKTIAVRGISLTASLGDLLLLMGPSGSGKTTLLTLIAGLVEPTRGIVRIFGRETQSFSAVELQRLRAERIGFIFQNFLLLEPLTVLENIAMVLRFAGTNGSVAQQRAIRLLEQLEIDHLALKYPGTLSQGEKQRVAIARAIANGADIIIADEPTASLDSSQGLEIILLLRGLAKEENKCVIVASHDLRLSDCADRVLRMNDGEIVSRSMDRIVMTK